jgi:pimeloyl-ACP methyl ester carboxylesterase
VLFLGAAVLVLAGCGSPSARFDARAHALGFQRTLIAGTAFEHVVFTSRPGRAGEAALHVYIGGDGTPWLSGRWLASDPTPTAPVALELASRDPRGALYLGRPCYHGAGPAERCHPALWSSKRYGAAVVSSMVAALSRLLERDAPSQVVLFGYSGGGTLAMLIAERLAQVAAVMTVAGNLDVSAWTALHGYETLTGSLDPGARAPLPARITQIHLVGADDRNVPPRLTRAMAARQQRGQVVVVPDYDHVCCWVEAWPSLLRLLDTRATPALRTPDAIPR